MSPIPSSQFSSWQKFFIGIALSTVVAASVATYMTKDIAKPSDTMALRLSETLSLMTPSASLPRVPSSEVIPSVLKEPSIQKMAQKLWDKQHGFLALSLIVENGGHPPPSTPFLDPASTKSHPLINVGFGYNITKRAGTTQKAHVESDLRRAGFSSDDIAKLFSHDPHQYTQVKVSMEQSLKLLLITEEEYQVRAQKFVGENTWKRMPQNQKDGLSYLAYNSDISQFKKLKEGLQKQNLHQILSNLDVCFSNKGKDQLNSRLTGYLISVMASSQSAKHAIFSPLRHELWVKSVFDSSHSKISKIKQAIKTVHQIDHGQVALQAQSHKPKV